MRCVNTKVKQVTSKFSKADVCKLHQHKQIAELAACSDEGRKKISEL